MNKAPAFQFYVADYMRDTRCLSLAAKGAWADCLCAMWFSSTRGEITYPLIGYARLFSCTVEQAETVINELVEMQTCDRVTHGDGKVTLTNRRMRREAKEREQANNRQNKYRSKLKKRSDGKSDGENDGEVTLHSSSSSSYTTLSSSNEKERGGKPPPAAEALNTQEESGEVYLERKQNEFHWLDVRAVYADFLDKCGSDRYPKLKNTRRQFDKWLANEDAPLEIEVNEKFVIPGIGELK